MAQGGRRAPLMGAGAGGTERRTKQGPVALAAAAQPEHRVFSREGEPVNLGGRIYHLAVLTVYGITRLQEALNTYDLGPFPTGDTLGRMIVNAAVLANKWEPFYDLMDLVLTAPFPRGAEQESDPDELQALLDSCFEHCGFNWLTRILKNLAAATATQNEPKAMALLEPLLRMAEAQALAEASSKATEAAATAGETEQTEDTAASSAQSSAPTTPAESLAS
jgi:hypothetical protein